MIVIGLVKVTEYFFFPLGIFHVNGDFIKVDWKLHSSRIIPIVMYIMAISRYQRRHSPVKGKANVQT